MWDRAAGIAEACARHDVPLLAAAVRFPLGHPDVRSVVVGCHTAAELAADVAAFRTPIPVAFWDELRERGLLHAGVPVPA